MHNILSPLNWPYMLLYTAWLLHIQTNATLQVEDSSTADSGSSISRQRKAA